MIATHCAWCKKPLKPCFFEASESNPDGMCLDCAIVEINNNLLASVDDRFRALEIFMDSV